jgi:hypothetical protein
VALVHAGATTWQAYNNWPGESRLGRSLYDYNSADDLRAAKVSFLRPYKTVGNQNLFEWEVTFAQWLESRGYDVAYATGIDTHRNPALLSEYQLVIVNGHDEYWSRAIRDGFDAALATGTNLAFMGADDAYWHIRFEDGDTTIVCHKEGDLDPVGDPSQKTVLFRDLVPPRPEAALIGVQFEFGMPNGYRDFVIADESLSDPWFAGTGFTPGAIVAGVVGYEYDTVVDASPDELTTFFRYAGNPAEQLPPGASTRFVHPSGATVFSAGTMHWPIVMKTDARLEKFTVNALDALFVAPGTPPNQLPGATITSPAPGASVQAGQAVDVAIAASDPDGSVARVELLEGATVVASTSTFPYTIAWTPVTVGPATLTARVTDAIGAVGTSPPVELTVTAPPPVADISLIGATSAGDNGRTSSAVLSLPAGVRAGDVILVGLQVAQSATTVQTPSGFAVVRDFKPAQSWHPRLVVYLKRAVGGETSVTVPTGSAGKSAVALVYRGVDPATPIAGDSTASRDGTSLTIGGLNAPLPGTRLIGVLACQNNSTPLTFGAPAGMTQRAAFGLPWLGIAAVDQTVGLGATGVRTTTASVNAALSGVLVTLRPSNTVTPPNSPPTVAVTSPADGAVTTAGSTVHVSADATDGDGAITSVDLLVDGNPLTTLTSPPYQAPWTPTAPGQFQITARAADDSGSTVTSAPVTVTVQAPPPASEITVVGANAAGDKGRRNNLTIPLPGGVLAGDLILAALQIAKSATGVQTPAGYSVVLDAIPNKSWHPRIVVFQRLASGNETSISIPTGVIGKTGAVIVYRNAASITATSAASVDGTSVTVPSVSAALAGTRLAGFWAVQNNSTAGSFGHPPGMTRQTGFESLPWMGSTLGDQVVGAGATGTRTATFPTSGAALAGALIAIRPTS